MSGTSKHGTGVEGAARAVNQHPVQVIAVTGGKGGVGKTTVAVNLAASLASRGKEVLLLDGDQERDDRQQPAVAEDGTAVAGVGSPMITTRTAMPSTPPSWRALDTTAEAVA